MAFASLFALLVACRRDDTARSTASEPRAGSSTRTAGPADWAAGHDAHAADPVASSRVAPVDPAALDALVARAGSTALPFVGLTPQGSASVSAPPPRMSDAAIERAMRAELYWPLTTTCRASDGSILPPDAVRVRFLIDELGTILPHSVQASAADPAFEAAAACMRRVLATTAFRGPRALRGATTRVDATVPSVD